MAIGAGVIGVAVLIWGIRWVVRATEPELGAVSQRWLEEHRVDKEGFRA